MRISNWLLTGPKKAPTKRLSTMRKFMTLGALVALVVAALALPALAQQ
jgi:hypothetical protein